MMTNNLNALGSYFVQETAIVVYYANWEQNAASG